MRDGRNFSNEPVQIDMRKYKNNWKIATGPVDVYTTAYFLDYVYSKNYYVVVEKHLNKQKALNADPKTKQQINFSGSPGWGGNKTMFTMCNVQYNIIYNLQCFSVLETHKKTILGFPEWIVTIL